jgi:UDP-N-acetylmuramoyl-L-alanyl-D-glutamate--2,6-diaminopimelate ligase
MLSTQREIVSLRATLPKARFLAGRDVLATSCSADWRACRTGDVFFALTTANDDGHEHAGAAIERGASAIVAERLLPVQVPQVLVQDSRSALARVCQALAGNPSQHLQTIGITGSAGKTVTAMLVASMFEAAGHSAGVMSSLGHSDSLAQSAATGQTPAPAEFASWLGRMQAANCHAAVLELSSQALSERRASGIELDAAIVTNIKNVDLNEHNTAAAYQKITRRIFNLLKSGGVAIVNADDHRCRNLLGKLNSSCLTYALHAEADITASVVERSASEQTFFLSLGSHVAPVRTRMIGDQHVSNCLAAAATGVAVGLDLNTIIRGLEAVERVPGRLERLECGQPFGVYVDAAASPETLALSIKNVRQVTRGRVFTVFGPQECTDSPRRALLGRVLERGTHVAILTSDEPNQPDPLKIAHDLLDGFERPHKAQVIPNRNVAIHYALGQARPGDAVLIAGRGDRVTRPSGGKGRLYDDRQTACDWLDRQGDSAPVRPRFRVVG